MLDPDSIKVITSMFSTLVMGLLALRFSVLKFASGSAVTGVHWNKQKA